MPVLFNFEVHTPYHLFFSGKAEVITLTISDGEIGVYAHHSPFTAPVVTCILKIKDEKGKWRSAFVTNGILEVKDHKNVLIVDAAQWPDEIDKERVIASKAEAENTLAESHLRFEIDKAKDKLRRAEYRLKVLELN